MLLLMRMRNYPPKSSLRTFYSLTKRSPSLVSHQLPRALSVLHPRVKEEDSKRKELESGDFSKFRISQETVELLKAKNITHLFPIQSETFDFIFDGEDVIAQARTGTGKTLSFILPLIEKLKLEKQSETYRQAPKVLVLAPTRELGKQIGGEFDYFKSSLRVGCFYGGVSYGPQAAAIERGLDIVIGTPGRLMDLVINSNLNLKELKYVVIDEVDTMLDMGFAPIVDDILQESYNYEEKPQTLVYSATLPPWVYKTAKKYMSKNKKVVDLIGTQSLKAAETVQHLAIEANKRRLAYVISDVVQVYCGAHSRALIFTETKRAADRLGFHSLLQHDSEILHGDISQAQREMALRNFREGKRRCLVATDVAARGLDIPEVDLVVLAQPPQDLDMYIHRSGRTGRAGRNGVSIVIHQEGELAKLRAVEKSTGIKFKHIKPPSADEVVKASASDAKRFIEETPPDMVEKFRDSAQALVEKLGAVEAVAAALAQIASMYLHHSERTGRDGIHGESEHDTSSVAEGLFDEISPDMVEKYRDSAQALMEKLGAVEAVAAALAHVFKTKCRSLITDEEGFITYLLRSRFEVFGTGYMWRALENFPELTGQVHNMRLCEDSTSVVVDVPLRLEYFMKEENLLKERRIQSVERITQLPELKTRRPRRPSSDRWSNRSPRYDGRESFRKDHSSGPFESRRASEGLKKWQ